MKLGMIGLGRMGGNMVTRLERDGHELVTYTRSGGGTVSTIEELVQALEPPRVAWMMVPAGDPTEKTLATLAPENGYAHCGPAGAGHFVKMIHNGIEYGLMQAYAEGFEIMHASEYDLDLPEIAGIWRYGSVVRSWLLELLYDALQQHGTEL